MKKYNFITAFNEAAAKMIKIIFSLMTREEKVDYLSKKIEETQKKIDAITNGKEIKKEKRNLTKIVIHHAPFIRTDDIKYACKVINREHQKFADLRQENSGSKYKNISYHFVVLDGKFIQTRDLDLVGYHAGNYGVNLESVGICVVGDYRTKEVSVETEETLINIIEKLLFDSNIKEIGGHNHWRKKPTACCGKKLFDWVEETYGEEYNPVSKLREGY